MLLDNLSSFGYMQLPYLPKSFFALHIQVCSRLHIVDGFEVPPVLWCMTIGDPSCKKSPATKPVFTVFKEIERENRPEYAKQRMIWEGKEVAYRRDLETINDMKSTTSIN
jgi:hypothetical protein